MSYELSDLEVKEIWSQACTELQMELSPAVFHTWVLNNPLTAIELLGDTEALCTITSPTAFHSTNLKKNLGDKLDNKLQTLLGRTIRFQFKIGTPRENTTNTPGSILASQGSPLEAGANQVFSQPQTATFQHLGSPLEEPREAEQPSNPLTHTNVVPPSFSQVPQVPKVFPLSVHQGLSPRVDDLFSSANMQAAQLDRAAVTAQNVGLRADYIFETFAVSTSNEMAHAAATAVSQRPGTAYNPLFLYGGVGVGKTHLMHAIGHNILSENPNTKIIYCTGEEFTNEIVSAIQNKKAIRFKDKFRTAQVLLIDDIQFIAGKNTVQEEFFHTFNALTQQARQIVLTSDRPPHEINLLEDRLRSRFEAGLMVDIQQPSFELRTAILLIKSKAVNLIIPIEIAKLIASRVNSARKIEGLLKRLKSAVELQKKEITVELVEAILQTEAPRDAELRLKVTPSDVIRTVANHYHVKQAAIRGQRRAADLVRARHVAMFLLKSELKMPLTEIGRWFSNRDHTSALHATNKIAEQLNQDDLLQRDVSALRMSLSVVSQ